MEGWTERTHERGGKGETALKTVRRSCWKDSTSAGTLRVRRDLKSTVDLKEGFPPGSPENIHKNVVTAKGTIYSSVRQR